MSSLRSITQRERADAEVRTSAVVRSSASMVAVIAFVCGFAAAEVRHIAERLSTADGSRIYTLYMGHADGRGGHDDVRRHVATFDLDESEPAANRDACSRLRTIMQNRASPQLYFWCEAGRFHG